MVAHPKTRLFVAALASAKKASIERSRETSLTDVDQLGMMDTRLSQATDSVSFSDEVNGIISVCAGGRREGNSQTHLPGFGEDGNAEAILRRASPKIRISQWTV
jgi:hypothetical protein